LSLGEQLLGSWIDCSNCNNDENGSVARFFAWLISICAWFCSDTIWLLICCKARAAVSTFCA
jgi:hypothetical protein